jgi:hypothetical protein
MNIEFIELDGVFWSCYRVMSYQQMNTKHVYWLTGNLDSLIVSELGGVRLIVATHYPSKV